jgi:hypothetical protein
MNISEHVICWEKNKTYICKSIAVYIYQGYTNILKYIYKIWQGSYNRANIWLSSW